MKQIADVVADAFEQDGDRGQNVVDALVEFGTEAEPQPNPAPLAERLLSFAKELIGSEKAAIKRENGIDFPPRDFAYVPDPNAPATWKLRLTESPGKVTLAQLGQAAAALSPGGFRGNKAEIPATALTNIKRRIRAEYLRLGVTANQIPATVKESHTFSVWKQGETLRWFAIYSNNFRDDDFPPEIISKESHELYVEMVDKGIVPMPELWHWHVPGTRWGVADWVGFSNGFALASGTVDQGHEQEAAALAEIGEIGVSHGMPQAWILRDETDPTVITMHVTTEISPLPLEAAANKMTGFNIFEGSNEMELTPQKKDHLLRVGVSADQLALLESGLKEAGETADQAGIESKEAPVADPPEEEKAKKPVAVDDEEAEATADDEEVEDPAKGKPPFGKKPKKKEADAEVPLTREEVAGAMAELIQAFAAQADEVKAALARISGEVESLGTEVKSLKETDEAKISKAASATPSLSLKALIEQSIIGQPEARIDGRSTLAKQKPAEKDAGSASITGNTILDRILSPANAGE